MNLLFEVPYWYGVFARGATVGRAFSTGAVRIFPLFYLQLAFTFFVDLSLHPIYHRYYASPTYARLYWIAQFATMVTAAWGVLFEVIRHGFACGRAKTFGRVALGILTIVVIVCGVLWSSRPGIYADTARNTFVERDFRCFEAFLIMSLLAARSYFRVQLSKQLKALLLGLGVYVGFSLLFLAGVSYAPKSIGDRFPFFQSSSYLVCVTIWLFGLWSKPSRPSKFATNFPQNGTPKPELALQPKQTVPF